jgi:hypothetical protein
MLDSIAVYSTMVVRKIDDWKVQIDSVGKALELFESTVLDCLGCCPILGQFSGRLRRFIGHVEVVSSALPLLFIYVARRLSQPESSPAEERVSRQLLSYCLNGLGNNARAYMETAPWVNIGLIPTVVHQWPGWDALRREWVKCTEDTESTVWAKMERFTQLFRERKICQHGDAGLCKERRHTNLEEIQKVFEHLLNRFGYIPFFSTLVVAPIRGFLALTQVVTVFAIAMLSEAEALLKRDQELFFSQVGRISRYTGNAYSNIMRAFFEVFPGVNLLCVWWDCHYRVPYASEVRDGRDRRTFLSWHAVRRLFQGG